MPVFLNNKILRYGIIGIFLLSFIGGMLPTSAYAVASDNPATNYTTPPKPAADGSGLDVMARFGQLVGTIILNLASAVTWFGGKLLELSITELILKIGVHLGNEAPLGKMIGQLWGFIRDICNMAFIFGFIYIGIRTIIDADDSGAKRMLASLIIGALLINFSLYFTKVIIDVSNYTAVEIYNTVFTGPDNASLSAKFAEQIGILPFYNVSLSGDVLAGLTGGGAFAFYFMAAILLIVAGFVFAAGAILILIRFVALIFIMVFSPILFAATIFDGTAHYAKDLWHKLLSYSFFAPAYLILLLVSIHVIGSAMGSINKSGKGIATALSEGSLRTQQADSFAVILVFLLGIMFLVMSLKIAQQFGIAGANKVIDAGNNLRGRGQKFLGGVTVGSTAKMGRATFGWAGNKLSESDGLKDASARRGLKGIGARALLKTSRVAADSSFDARNIAGMGGQLGIGEGRKGGYQTVKEEIRKKEEEFAKSLGQIEDTDVKVEARKKEMQFEEKNLRRLEEELNAIDKSDVAARAKKREDIEKKKKEIQDAKIKYESEKQRRIIGSTYMKPRAKDVPKLGVYENQIDTFRSLLKNRWENYVTLTTEADKENARINIQQIKDDLEKAENDQYALLNQQDDRGYAGKLEDPSKFRVLSAWPMGRQVHHERAAGKDIREAAQKGLPKKKED